MIKLLIVEVKLLRRHHIIAIKNTGKISLLVLFAFITVGSNPKPASFTVINENNNMTKMVDIQQISVKEEIEVARTEELVVVAEDLIKKTNAANSRLSLGMDLGEPTGFSSEQFKKALMQSRFIENDKHDIIKNNIDLFYNAEQKYGINGMFLLSLAAHESGWGTSKLAINKRNLFGLIGMKFDSYESCIDYAAQRLVRSYLNPKGTIVKGLEKPASGSCYNGNTIASVNIVYAADRSWTTKIFQYMEHFYGNVSK